MVEIREAVMGGGYLDFQKFVPSDEPLMNLYHFFAFVFLNDRTENAFPLFMIML
jgi:hypothetical protein